MAKSLKLNVNGKSHAVTVEPDMPLLYALRDELGMKEPRFGCGLAQCGACTVLINGVPTRSCVRSRCSKRIRIRATRKYARRSRASSAAAGRISPSCVRSSARRRLRRNP